VTNLPGGPRQDLYGGSTKSGKITLPSTAPATGGTGSLMTQRGREPDSNGRSRSCEKLCWTANQDAGTGTEGTEG
jgi:hypothetical protein